MSFSSSFRRIIEWFRMEGASGIHLVQPPVDLLFLGRLYSFAVCMFFFFFLALSNETNCKISEDAAL